jgi:uncharacterized protein involved in response to NO
MHPILAVGFRPFYLLAALFAVAALPLWMGFYFDLIPAGGYLVGISWHTHEMLFGFAPAVIAGFLLTAAQHWTGRPTATGSGLLALAVLWLLARVLMLTGPPPVAAVVDLLFLPTLAVVVAIPITRSGNYRNLPVLTVLVGLWLANLVFHLAHLNIISPFLEWLGMLAALDVILILLATMAGRIIPSFIASAIPSARPRRNGLIEFLAIGSLVLLLCVVVLNFFNRPPALVTIVLLIVATLSHTIRLALWDPLKTREQPLLWMLPVAYAWVPLALLLRTLSVALPEFDQTIGIHALTVGAVGGLMLAMMTRSALGHTGRELKAGPTEMTAFLLVQVGGLVRVFPNILWPDYYAGFLVTSTVLWSLAFAIFVAGYWPILTRPRLDVRPD